MNVLQIIIGVIVALGISAALGLGLGLAALAIGQPVPATVLVVGVELAIIIGSALGIRKGRQPFLMGLYFGFIAGSLLCGICATGIAVSPQLNMH